MGRKAKPLQQQVDLLKSRGMRVDDPERARQLLLEIGWYRMSLYWFPFEKRYPDILSPDHHFKEGVSFHDALLLYAFDFNLRNTLLKPLERIETAFRTYLIYTVSNRYPDSPAWFVDKRVVSAVHANSFERAIYIPLRKQNYHIQLHHRRFPGDKFAPAWKTLEFTTLGTMCNLYEALNSSNLRSDVAHHFGVHQEEVFKSYMDVVRGLRNYCAHGNVLYSFVPPPLPKGPAMDGRCVPPHNLYGALSVVEHFLKVISTRLHDEFKNDVASLIAEFGVTAPARYVLRHISGFKI